MKTPFYFQARKSPVSADLDGNAGRALHGRQQIATPLVYGFANVYGSCLDILSLLRGFPRRSIYSLSLQSSSPHSHATLWCKPSARKLPSQTRLTLLYGANLDVLWHTKWKWHLATRPSALFMCTVHVSDSIVLPILTTACQTFKQFGNRFLKCRRC